MVTKYLDNKGSIHLHTWTVAMWFVIIEVDLQIYSIWCEFRNKYRIGK